MYAKYSCSVYMIITGYFLCEKKGNNYDKMKKLIIQMFFYSIFIAIMVKLVMPEYNMVDRLIGSLIPFVTQYWYINVYLVMLLIAPWLNDILRKADKELYRKILIGAFLIFSVIPTFFPTWSSLGRYYAGNMSNFGYMFFMYCMGVYLRLHYENNKNNKINFFIMASMILLLALSVPLFHLLGDLSGVDLFVKNATYLSNPYSFIQILAAVYTFLFFVKIDFKCRFINKISATMLGVYMFHEHFILRNIIWSYRFSGVSTPIGNAGLLIIFVFVGGIIIEIGRILVFRLFSKLKCID